jgi:RNA polymerase sigma factor (sigma-70 family)
LSGLSGSNGDEGSPRAVDADWLASTYHALKHDLLTVAVHLTGERAAGEDLVHDVFVAFAHGRDRPVLATIDDARRYLVTSCVHRARDLGRRRGAELDGGARLDRTLARDGDPLPRLAADDESARVRAALRELPVAQRAVVTLHQHGGLKFREIAEVLGVPLDTATSRYRYALAKLERSLVAKGVKS